MKFTSDFVGNRQVVSSLKKLGTEGVRAMTRATNKAGDKARTLSSREIREDVSLKASYVRQKLRVRRANYKQIEYTISAPRRGVLMARYTHRQLMRGGKRKGVSVKIKRRGARVRMNQGFVTTLKAGSKLVQVIAVPVKPPGGGKRPKYRTGKYKIKVLYAPSVSQVYNTVRDRITQEVVRYYDQQVLRELVQAEKRAGLQ